MYQETLSDDDWLDVQSDLNNVLDDFRSIYGDDANDNEIVAETDEWILFRDGSGHELNEIAEANGVDRDDLSRRMHNETRRKYNSDEPGDEWSVSDPIIVYKHV